jgi:protein-disulfide isomerase
MFFQSIIIFGLVFIGTILIWSVLKKILTQQKELKEFQLKGNRFMRNYEVFKNTLLSTTKVNTKDISSGIIVVGNDMVPLKITLVSNPFCGHCKEAHSIVEEILQKYNDKVCFQIQFNFNPYENSEMAQYVHQQLVGIYYQNGQESFMNALRDWYEYKDESRLKVTDTLQMSDLKINEILYKQYQWNQENGITFTPAFIINQYLFPKVYDRKELISEDQEVQ